MVGTVHVDRLSGGVVLLEIDSPPMNAMSNAMLTKAIEVMDEVQADDDVRAILLTGRGRAFCSGADLKEAAHGSGEDLSKFGHLCQQVSGSRAPVIAAINGACVGGGFELALCCDVRLASISAKFVCAGVNVGLMASSIRLPRLIGLSRAKEMLLTGSPYDAVKAEQWGLVTGVAEPDALRERARILAQRIASRAPLSVEATKRTADRALDLSPEDAARMISDEMPALRGSYDHREGVMAFVERREPQFARR